MPFDFRKRQVVALRILSVQAPAFREEVEVPDGIDGVADDERVLGDISLTLARVMGSPDREITLPVPNMPGASVTTVAAPGGVYGNEGVVLSFRGAALAKMDTFGLSDPYFFLTTDRGVRLYRSETIDTTLDPVWRETPVLAIDDLVARRGRERRVRFDCFDADLIGSDDAMGGFDFFLKQILELAASGDEAAFTLRDAAGGTFGTVYMRARRERLPSLLDMLRGGLQLNLNVAIDFTSLNGQPYEPDSLHSRVRATRPNVYTRAIQAVGEVLIEYDSDKLVPLYGFGAQVAGASVSHAFSLTMRSDPNVRGIDGVLAAYTAFLQRTDVTFASPAHFAPIITTVAAAARAAKNTYTVLLLLTNGMFNDRDAAIDAIVAADDAPLSIVIVGVGYTDFQAMMDLDGDMQRLTARNGRVCRRDLVQFVPFKDFEQPGAAVALSDQVLEELPRQVTEWARMNQVYFR
jgi:hypothetical protein